MYPDFVQVESSVELEQCEPSDNIRLEDNIQFEYPTQCFDEFTGVLDGNGYEISNIYTVGETQVGGLVNVLNGGTIKNIDVNTTVECQTIGGGVVGVNKEGVLQNVSCTGIITGKENIGGLVGNNNGIVTSSSFNGKIYGRYNVGGITGVNNHKIKECYTEGEIKSNYPEFENVGGISGKVWNGTIQSCLAMIYTPESREIGGIAGEIKSACIKHCYCPFYNTYSKKIVLLKQPVVENNCKESIPMQFQHKLTSRSKFISHISLTILL